MKLWGGRFQKDTDLLVNELNASISFDQRLYREDITGSMAHAAMLADCGIISKEDAAAKVAVSAADNVVTIANGYDVNMTGVVDINDAQLVYDIYNGTYGDFGKVSMEKFLRADVNASKNVDSADAVAIVSQFK